MKVLMSWYGSKVLFIIMFLFFGFIGIHSGLSVYFGVPTPIETNMTPGFNMGVTCLSWFMVIIAVPVLYKIHKEHDAKYKEVVKISLDDLNTYDYSNLYIVEKDNFAWALNKSPIGYDIESIGYFTFTNYYNKDGKFQTAILNTQHVKL